MSCLDHNLSRLFSHLGRNIGKYPGYYITIPFLVAIIFSTGLQQMRYEDDPEYLFSPTDGASKHERALIDKLFPMNYSHNFNLGRITHKGRFGRIIAIAKDESNILTKKVFDEIVQLDRAIKNITIKFDDEPYVYETLCARSEGKCFENDILDFVSRIEDIESHKFWLKYPIWINADIYKAYFFPAYLGGVKTDSNDLIENAKAISLMYWLDISQKHGDEKAAIWEEAFLAEVQRLSFKHINVARFVSTTLRTELESNTQSLVPFFSITIIIMLVFSVGTCMMADWVRSKPWLGLLGCVSAGIGVLAAFGFTCYLGVDMIGINLAAPFLMLGVGMDDAFVLVASWRRTNPNLPVSERMSETYAEAAVSITITSLTNFISFLIGTYTPFPSVRIFCIYTAVAVITTYVFHITFFGACLVYFGRAEKRNLHGLALVPVMPKSLAKDKGLLFRLLCTGGRNQDDPDNEEDNKEHSMMIFFRDTLAKLLNRSSIKCLVLLVFAVYLVIGIYGCTQLKEGLDRRKLSRDDSYSVAFYDYEDRFFREYPYRIQVVINDTLNYADPRDQEKVEKMLSTFESSPYIGNRSMTESWLRAYLEFLNQEDSFLFLQALNMSEKADFYRGFRDVFLKFPMTEAFRNDVVFNEDGTEIIATRFMIQTHNIKDANMEKDMLIALRGLASSSPLNVTIYHQLFIFFDQFILVREISLQTITVAAIVMMVISMMFIPSPSCAIWVAFSIISIEVGVIGYMTLWNVNLDSISMINLIMCIGFSVDFSAHISYAYISCNEPTAAERVSFALYSLGLPIFQGSVSTILGIIALAFAPSYVFVVFFKTVFLVMLFGATHGVLLLPVLLSLTDICRPRSSPKNKADSSTSLTPGYPGLDLTGVPHPFLISDKTFDGKKITASVNPIFIPRPSLTGVPGITGSSPPGSGIVDEDSGAGSKSSASSEASVGVRDKDCGLGTSSGEDCSEGSWGKGKSPETHNKDKSGQMIVTSSETTNLSSGLINTPNGSNNLAQHLYSRWPPASGIRGGEGHVNREYINDSGEVEDYDPPLPVISHIHGHYGDVDRRSPSSPSSRNFANVNSSSFNRSAINRLSAYHDSAAAADQRNSSVWSRQLITTPMMTKGSNSNVYNSKPIDNDNFTERQIKHRSGTGSREQSNNHSNHNFTHHYQTSLSSEQHQVINNPKHSSMLINSTKPRHKSSDNNSKEKFTKSYVKGDVNK